MKHWRNPGLWLALAITLAIGVWPALAGNKAYAREVAFTVIKGVSIQNSKFLSLSKMHCNIIIRSKFWDEYGMSIGVIKITISIPILFLTEDI